MSERAGVFLAYLKQLGIDYRDPQAQEHFASVVDQAVTECLNDHNCIIKLAEFA